MADAVGAACDLRWWALLTERACVGCLDTPYPMTMLSSLFLRKGLSPSPDLHNWRLGLKGLAVLRELFFSSLVEATLN